MLLFVLQHDGFTKQIAEGDSKRPCHVREDIKTPDPPLADAELIIRTAHVTTLSAASDALAGRFAIGSPAAQRPAVARLTG